MERSSPPGCYFCHWSPEMSLPLNSAHCSQRPSSRAETLDLSKAVQVSHLASYVLRKHPLVGLKEHVWGLSLVAIICLPRNYSLETANFEGRWPWVWKASPYSHAREPLAFSAGRVLPQTITCLCHGGAHLIFSWKVAATLSKLPTSVSNTSTTKLHLRSHFWCLSGVPVKPLFAIILFIWRHPTAPHLQQPPRLCPPSLAHR